MNPWIVTLEGEVLERGNRRLLGSARARRIESRTFNLQLAMRTVWIAKLAGGPELGQFNTQGRAAAAVFAAAIPSPWIYDRKKWVCTICYTEYEVETLAEARQIHDAAGPIA